MKIYDESFALLLSFKAHTNYINRIKQSPFNNVYVATISYNSAKIWNMSNWTLIQSYTNHTTWINGLEFIDEDTIATGSNDKTIHIWSMSTGISKRTISTGSFCVYALKILSNGYYLAAGTDNSISIYDLNTGNLATTPLTGHVSSLFGLELVGDSLLASAGHSPDNTVRIWNLTTYTSVFVLRGHNDSVHGLKLVSSDILASSSVDKTVKLWNITNGTLIRTLSNHTGSIMWSIDMLNSEILVSGSGDLTIKLWDMNKGEVIQTISTSLSIRSLAVLNISKTSRLAFVLDKVELYQNVPHSSFFLIIFSKYEV
jgi:WD40 repeat protein